MSLRGSLLLVDNDRLVLTTLAHGLTHAGYTVFTAESADEAEEIIVQMETPPTLAIIDVRMPSRSGLELAVWLNSSAHVPFMFLTAYNDDEIIETARVHGALGYLVKPIDTPQLLPSIEAAVARANDLKSLQTTGEQLKTALENQRDINVAVGITMVQHKLSRQDAFELLRKTARNQRRKLGILADEVIKASEVLLNLKKNIKPD